MFSGPDHDATVLVQYEHQLGVFEVCSGILLAPNVLATARHCVADWTREPFACDVQGNALGDGGTFVEDLPVEGIKVFVGREGHNLAGGTPSALGVAVYHDGGPTLCSHDVAFVLLDRELEGLPLLPVRLGQQPTVGEDVTLVAFGDDDGATGVLKLERTYRSGLTIEEVGPLEADPDLEGVGLPPKAFASGPAICQGDSGGPAISDDTGAVVGIAASHVGTAGVGIDPCSLATVQSVFMQLAAFEAPLREAFEAAGQPIWEEGHPEPATVEVGGECLGDIDCQSGGCRDDGEALVCAQSCAADSDCGSGSLCDLEDGGYCVAESSAESGSGCAFDGRRSSDHGWWLALLGLALLRRRR